MSSRFLRTPYAESASMSGDLTDATD